MQRVYLFPQHRLWVTVVEPRGMSHSPETIELNVQFLFFSIFYTISADMSSTRQLNDMLTQNNTSASGCPGSLGR